MNSAAIFKQRLQQLIAAPSVSCTLAEHDMSNLQVIHLLSNWLEELGFDCKIQPVSEGKANLIACIGRGSGGLVLSGHSDTVPYDESRWQSDPFTLTETNQRLYGLGTCDMKAYFPVILAAIENLDVKNQSLTHPLFVIATSDEESSMDGARALVKQSVNDARYAIIGEPTGLVPIRMHKGITMERLRIKGKAGHSSNPALGSNAIDAMHKALTELTDFRNQLQQKYQHPGFTVAEPTMNFGCIHGGDNPNRICGECILDFDIRPLPGMAIDQIHQELEQRLQKLTETCEVSLTLERLFPGVEAFEQAHDSPLVELAESLSGHQSESVAFATEAPYLQALGMQTIVMGPGSIDQAHQPNEFLDTAQIDPAIAIIENAIRRCCL